MQADESLIHPSVNLILGVVIEHWHVHKQTTVNNYLGKTRRNRSFTKPFQTIVGTHMSFISSLPYFAIYSTI